MIFGGTMSPAIAIDICRITVIGPRRRVDIALPAHVPFADLFSAIARLSMLDSSDLNRAPGGWSLQRLGQRSFEPTDTPASAGLLDGELVYLRPRVTELPEMVSDDIADEISGVHDGSGRWGTGDARRVSLSAGAAALLAGAVVIARSGMPVPELAAVAGGMVLLLLTAAAAVSRAAGDAIAGVMLGYAALPYAFLAGLAAESGTQAGGGRVVPALGGLVHAGALGMLAGFAVLLFAAVVAAAAVALPAFLGVAIAALFGVAASWLACSVQVTAAGAAALAVTLALALASLIPGLAFRLARLRLPSIPASAEDLRNDALLSPAPDVRDRAAAADRIVAGALCGIGLIGGGAELALGLGHGLLPRVMAVVLAGALLLRSLVFRGRAQRLWLMIPAVGGLVLLCVVAGGPFALLALAVGAALVIGVGTWLTGHRPSPFWRRAADIADTALVIALLPVALGVAGVLGRLHGLGG
jgi:type VII secretion integral membrane protein EccD